MDSQQLLVLNPNYFHGCHPSIPTDDAEATSSSSQSSDVNVSSSASHPFTGIAEVPLRRQALEHLLNKYVSTVLAGKKQFEAYMHHKYRRNCSVSTLRLTATSLSLFLQFYQKTEKRQLEQLTRGEIEAFVEFEQDRGLTPNTVRTRLCALYAFIRFLVEKKIVGYELLEAKIKLKLPDTLPRAIDPEDLSCLLSVISRARDRALILLLLRTGMRIGEMLSTRVADVDLREQKILIFQAEKTAVGRVVYYSDDAQAALIDWLRRRDPSKVYLFYGQRRSRLSYQAARMMFKKYLHAAGLGHRGYTLHCLRHSFATELLNAGMRLECLQVLLGHTNLEVTRRYARLSDKTRETEYFAAMSRIEKGDRNAVDQCDY